MTSKTEFVLCFHYASNHFRENMKALINEFLFHFSKEIAIMRALGIFDRHICPAFRLRKQLHITADNLRPFRQKIFYRMRKIVRMIELMLVAAEKIDANINASSPERRVIGCVGNIEDIQIKIEFFNQAFVH